MCRQWTDEERVMAALEQEILEQISKLDEAKQRQVLEFARRLATQPDAGSMTWAEWLVLADQANADIQAKYGQHTTFNTQALLDELREEEST
jgi:hypothetical protein